MWGELSVAGWAWWSATASMKVSGKRQAANTRAAASSWAMPKAAISAFRSGTPACASGGGRRLKRGRPPAARRRASSAGPWSAPPERGGLPVLFPRHLNVAESVHLQAKDLIENWLYEQGSEDGWWYCPYGCQGGGAVGLSQETILRNTLGLKNVVGILLEARSAGGATRPNDGSSATPNSRKRKTFSALYTYHQFLDYFRANQTEIAQAIEEGEDFQVSNTGRIVFRGSYDVPAFPPPHPGEAPPPPEIPGPDQILDEPVCGYLLTEEQYNGPRSDSPAGFPTTLADRIAAHGWRVQERSNGYMVPLTQPERGLIPLLLDGQAAEPWVDAKRLYGPPGDAQAPLPDSACGLGRGAASPDRTPSQSELNYITD